MIQPGDKAELNIHKLLARTFFRDFLFENPEDQKNKEVTDSLVLFYDSLILVQSKSKNTIPFAESQEKEERWARKNIDKAKRQLLGAYRNIKDRRFNELEHRYRGIVNLPPIEELSV